MSRAWVPQRALENTASSLGLSRISQINVQQVLHASKADIFALRGKLRSWQVHKFNSYPLLLRALTHPSISNWAERVMELPPRSLGPNTMELVGDRVVGTSTARHILSWVRDPATAPELDWTGGARLIVNTLLRNRGMALTARDMGIESFMRWEKSRPPAAHRERLDRLGIDLATGMQSNVEVNALAAAFEAVSAAVYLDGGFDSVHRFVHGTLLRKTIAVQQANRESNDFELMLLRELRALFGAPVAFTSAGYPHTAAGGTPPSRFPMYERVEAVVLDMQQEASEKVNAAHALFYGAVVLRRVSKEARMAGEFELISLASHFSVQTARQAALTQAIAALRGEYKTAEPRDEAEELHEERMFVRDGSMRDGGIFEGMFDKMGRWRFDGDYRHLGDVLQRAGLGGFEQVEGCSGSDIQERLRSRRETRIRHEEEELVNRSATRDNQSVDVEGRFPRVAEQHANIDGDSMERQLRTGAQVNAESGLGKTFAVVAGAAHDAEDVVCGLDEAVRELGVMDGLARNRVVDGLHALGAQTVKLWAVQCSVTDIAQDRVDAVGPYEQRLMLKAELEREMLGRFGLSGVRDGLCRKLLVGVGMCAERFGTATTLAWLSGAEADVKGRDVA